jgi:importin subunit alpha-1
MRDVQSMKFTVSIIWRVNAF